MRFVYPSNKADFVILVTIKTKSPAKIRIFATDVDINQKINPNNGVSIVPTYYIDRRGLVNGERTFQLQFPMSPKEMFLYIYNVEKGNLPFGVDNSFEIVDYKVEKLKKYDMIQSQDVFEFVELAEWFCRHASNISANFTYKGNVFPSIYRSDSGKFCITYFDKIIDRNSGKVLTTPARIAHASGIIEVSKSDFMKWTVPMRMAILLHEFSHKYMNPKSGLDITDETGADINALNIYLGLGYPAIEGAYAFLKVFDNKNANNAGNHKRYIIINDFIKKFLAGDLENKCKETYF